MNWRSGLPVPETMKSVPFSVERQHGPRSKRTLRQQALVHQAWDDVAVLEVVCWVSAALRHIAQLSCGPKMFVGMHEVKLHPYCELSLALRGRAHLVVVCVVLHVDQSLAVCVAAAHVRGLDFR